MVGPMAGRSSNPLPMTTVGVGQPLGLEEPPPWRPIRARLTGARIKPVGGALGPLLPSISGTVLVQPYLPHAQTSRMSRDARRATSRPGAAVLSRKRPRTFWP